MGLKVNVKSVKFYDLINIKKDTIESKPQYDDK